MIRAARDASATVRSAEYTVRGEGSKSDTREARVLIVVLGVRFLKGVVLQRGVATRGTAIDNVRKTYYRCNRRVRLRRTKNDFAAYSGMQGQDVTHTKHVGQACCFIALYST